jgi:hypothetical protein
MVKIFKGDKNLTVTKSAFDNYYKNAGWLVKQGNLVTVKGVVEESKQEDEWDGFDEEAEVEKPLSDMNRDELVEKALSLGIEIPSTVNNKQLRELIKSHK